MSDELVKIEYKGRSVNRRLKPLTDEQFKDIKDYIYKKPEWEDVKNELIALKKGKLTIPMVRKWYYQDLLFQARNIQDKWTIEEALEHKPIIEVLYRTISGNDKIFEADKPLGYNILTAFRLSGIGICRTLPNFPLKSMDMLFEKYMPNGGNYYDYSCGWAVRMVTAMRNGINYFGTDPNDKLVERLNQIANDYNEVNGTDEKVKIYAQGSEVFIPELENTIDFSFSSPPYFKLELYTNGEQSCSEDTDYANWKNDYLLPTIQNAFKYLKPGGVFGINIKDVKINNKIYPLCSDSCKLIESVGFEFMETCLLKNITRPAMTKGKTDEDIFIFKKPII